MLKSMPSLSLASHRMRGYEYCVGCSRIAWSFARKEAGGHSRANRKLSQEPHLSLNCGLAGLLKSLLTSSFSCIIHGMLSLSLSPIMTLTHSAFSIQSIINLNRIIESNRHQFGAPRSGASPQYMADHTSLFIKMKLLCCFAFAAVACCATPPHIVFVLTDDNGWAGVGYNNPHVSTPTLDNLAAGGLKLTSHCKSRALCISHFASRADNRPPPLSDVLQQTSTSTVRPRVARSSQVVIRTS